MRDDVVVTVRLPEASPDAYIRLTRACREGAGALLRDPLLEELAAAVSWQLVDQAVRARLDGVGRIAPRLEVAPEHVELAREYVHQGRPVVDVAAAEDPQIRTLLLECLDTVEEAFSDREYAGAHR